MSTAARCHTRRSRSSQSMDSARPIGAPISVGLLLLTGDWRMTFIVLGISSLVLLYIFASIFTDRPDQCARVNAAELARITQSTAVLAAQTDEGGDRPSWFSFFSSRTLICNAVGYFAFLYITFLLLTWTPKYLQDQFHYNLSSLWYVGMIPWMGSCLTVVIGGRLSDRILAMTGSLIAARSWFAAGWLPLAGLFFIVGPLGRDGAGLFVVFGDPECALNPSQ